MNIFRTNKGDIITYKGKKMYYPYLSFFGYDLDSVVCGEIDSETSRTKYRELYEKFQVSENYETNYEHIAKHKQQYYSEQLEKDVLILKNSEYITLTGTVKEHSEYNEIKQTLIQRPKLKS